MLPKLHFSLCISQARNVIKAIGQLFRATVTSEEVSVQITVEDWESLQIVSGVQSLKAWKIWHTSGCFVGQHQCFSQ